MSSSSSLSAAKRRRGHTVNGPPPSQTTRTSNNNSQKPQTTQPAVPIIPPNPMDILRQHHMMLGDLNDKITELSSNSDLSNENNNESTQQFNTDEVATLLIGKIEEQLDLKALYDNDNNLATEIDKLHQIINNQQLVLNHMNRLLYFVIENLNLEKPDFSLSDKEKDTKIIVDNLTPTFTNKSVKINENLNETKEFNNDNNDEGLEVGSVE